MNHYDSINKSIKKIVTDKDGNHIQDLESLFKEVAQINSMENLDKRTLAEYYSSLELICGSIKLM